MALLRMFRSITAVCSLMAFAIVSVIESYLDDMVRFFTPPTPAGMFDPVNPALRVDGPSIDPALQNDMRFERGTHRQHAARKT